MMCICQHCKSQPRPGRNSADAFETPMSKRFTDSSILFCYECIHMITVPTVTSCAWSASVCSHWPVPRLCRCCTEQCNRLHWICSRMTRLFRSALCCKAPVCSSKYMPSHCHQATMLSRRVVTSARCWYGYIYHRDFAHTFRMDISLTPCVWSACRNSLQYIFADLSKTLTHAVSPVCTSTTTSNWRTYVMNGS